MNLPDSVSPHIAINATWRRVDHAGNAGQVYRITAPNVDPLYLKIYPRDAVVSLARERDVLTWLGSRVRVPKVLAYGRRDEVEYLLLTELSGRSFIDPQVDSDSLRLARWLAQASRQLHSIDITNCPFDRRLPLTLRDAALTAAPNPIDPQLLTSHPGDEDLVFTHGDYCLPNIFIDDQQNFGYLDLARAGVADRYLDLACAAHTLRYNDHDEQAVQLFFDTYGVPIDPDKLKFYAALNKLL